MSRQNRVTPFGDLVARPGRGLLMGNRGVLHDGAGVVVRYAQGRRWIACVTAFRGRRREVMKPGAYTELFFLDEAVALAAGHRPCVECRREDFVRFRTIWTRCHGPFAGVDDLDARLHAERLAGPRTRRTHRAPFASLPDGAYVALDGAAWLVRGGALLAWSDAGYAERRARPATGDAVVITPPSVVACLAAGYAPLVHPSVVA